MSLNIVRYISLLLLYYPSSRPSASSSRLRLASVGRRRAHYSKKIRPCSSSRVLCRLLLRRGGIGGRMQRGGRAPRRGFHRVWAQIFGCPARLPPVPPLG